MAQRLFALLLSCYLCWAGMATAEPAKADPAPKSLKSPEQRYLEATACLKKADTECVQLALAGISPASPYAKLLEAQLAAIRQDFDTVLRRLLPLQAESGLLPQAIGSLHATLALAYEHQDNPLSAIVQRSMATPYLDDADAEANQSRLWQILAQQTRDSLLDMRGESPDSTVQGWIDLALAIHDDTSREAAIRQWRASYPDHPASESLLASLSVQPAMQGPVTPPLQGRVAILLPLEAETFADAAQAVLAGIRAAHQVSESTAELQLYSVTADGPGVLTAYRQALQDGARFVLGPLTREGVSAIAEAGDVPVPTIALNHPESTAGMPTWLLPVGRPIEAEARQVAEIGRRFGMQTAQIIAADDALGKRMATAFAEAWQALDGTVTLQVCFAEDTDLIMLKAQTAVAPADMVFLAANADQARRVRPYLDPATPTFATSPVYDGIAGPHNAALAAVRFVDMPWLLDADNPDFSAYRAAASALPSGEAQRWFAVGVDAWRTLQVVANGTPAPIHGLSGNLRWLDGRPVRSLSLGVFRGDTVVMDPLP